MFIPASLQQPSAAKYSSQTDQNQLKNGSVGEVSFFSCTTLKLLLRGVLHLAWRK
jgi:hypothetical protein